MGGVKSKFVRCCACFGYKKEKETFDIPTPDFSESSEAKKLVVHGIDFCTKINGKHHHTKRFDLMKRKDDKCLVIRRGQEFDLQISLSRPFNVKTDDLSFVLQVEDENTDNDVITAKFTLSKDGTEAKNKWNAVYKSQSDTDVTVSVTSPADCVVAKWAVEIKATVRSKAGVATFVYTHPQPLYILFNPWCEKDSVFMKDARHREEYVENDEGIVYKGNSNAIQPKSWYYAQFDKDILECAVYLMKNIGKLKGRARGESIATVRALTAAVNANDSDNGVLTGNWGAKKEDYANGTEPWLWMGSLEILQSYYKSKTPVGYAQCWVFAGVLTTVCRALGLPCRPVTCFSSAHDGNKNLTIETMIDENGEEKQLDSVWNFHVWNEAWMARPDLGAAYGGWQIVDSTPQERSDGTFRCGPASLAAVYNGDTQLPYDVPFVFAEVNADWVKWKYTGSDHKKQLVVVDTTTVGKKISTKAIGSMEREDLTDHYKSPESTNRERETLVKALLESHSEYAKHQYYRTLAFTDVKLHFEVADNVVIGQNFEVVLHMRNESSTTSHRVTGIYNLKTETYTGRHGDTVREEKFDVKLKPEEKFQVTMLVSFDDYYKKLVDQASFKILCVAKISDVDYIDIAKFMLRDPEIKIEFGSETLQFEMENPLPMALNNGRFFYRASNMNQPIEIKVNQSVKPGAKAEAIQKFVPPSGRCHIMVQFFSDEFKYVDGFYTLDL